MDQSPAPEKRKSGWFWRLVDRIRSAGRAITPGPRAWRGAAWGLIIITIGLVLYTTYNAFAPFGLLAFVLGFLALLVIAVLLKGLTLLLIRLDGAVPVGYKTSLVGAVPLLFVCFLMLNLGFAAVLLGIIGVSSLLGAAVWVLLRGGWRSATKAQRAVIGLGLILGLVGLIGGGAWLLNDGSPVTPPQNAAAQAGAVVIPLAVEDPSQPGPYAVQTLFYGSGSDQRRPEYGSQVDLVTQAVDGSKLVEDWSGLRSQYWGFGPEAMPVNGRVWFPDGPGPFPLVLIVHGNHEMEAYSDPGYAYLGELLASRGFILVSVDENFLNLSPTADLLFLNGLQEENDARGWLLLEHLQVWQGWNADPGSPFYQKVDLNNLALMGHSRGGEAVAVAAAFNHLPFYPDDASLAFDYNFNIRSVVAIAPVDAQYQPTDQLTPLENVNYLVLHGAQDMDVASFSGSRQYERIRFTDGQFWVKAGVYIYGANHGQFNTVWGRKDGFEPGMRLMNLTQLMPPDEQQQIAKVYITAFLEATLHNQTAYLPVLRDHRTAAGWLPDTIYISQYLDSTTRMLSDYEEDINLATTTLPGGSLQGQNLTLWREQVVPLKWDTLNTNAAYLGWDTTADSAVPIYEITLPDGSLVLGDDSTLVMSLANANEPPTADAEEANTDLIDLTIEVIDRRGAAARLPLSHFAYLQPQIEDHLPKASWMALPAQTSEVVFQSFEFPLSAFSTANPAFDPTNLASVRLVFDRTPSGVVVLDNLGFRVGE